MSNNFQPTSSKEIFVGRQAERDLFTSILEGRGSGWIIHIPGEGGIGKSRLLEMIRQQALKHYDNKVLVTRELVDFYNATNQTDFGLLRCIAESINLALFENFLLAKAQFDEVLKTEPEPAHRQDTAHKVLQAFLADHKKLIQEGYMIVWLLDTCEEMGKVESYVLEKLLPAIHEQELVVFNEQEHEADAVLQHHTIVVIAGRKKLTFPEELTTHVLKWGLQPLSGQEFKQFFARAQSTAEFSEIEAAKLERLYELTGGRPMYVALSYDWLKNEIGTIDELLSLDEPFGEKLVGWVRRLDTLDKRTILYTALAWRRMEPSLLSCLLQITEPAAVSLIQQLSKFSFIKYRPPSENDLGAFQLHDEMRELILKYVGLQEGEIARNEVLSQVIDWYAEHISDQDIMGGQKLPVLGDLPSDLTRALLVEWLYYLLQFDLEQGYAKFDQLFRNASHNLDMTFCEMLIREVERFIDYFGHRQMDDLHYKQALIAFRRDQYDFAGQTWRSLARQDDVPVLTRAIALMMLVELDGYQGKPDEALECAEESMEIFKALLNQTPPEHQDAIKKELGYLYNNLGYAYRVKGDYESALKYYDLALASAGKQKNIARTLNNMGFIYYQLGDLINARTYVGRALQIRRSLKIPYELGLGYNTMGIIMEHIGRMDDAADSYHKAQSSFEVANSDRGRALVLMNIGRLDRRTNRYEDAENALKKAINVFEQQHDRDNLLQALNELGCVYRQRGEEPDWEKSEVLHKKSLEYSENLGRARNQADTWEDLCILYERHANDLRNKNEEVAKEQYVKLARMAAEKVRDLAEKYGYHYLLAKKERTLADLEFGEKRYEEAFKRYFDTCNLMIKARLLEKVSPILWQRRYETMVDRLQEQLQALPTLEETRKYAELMLTWYRELDDTDKEQLVTLKDFLIAADDMASKVSE